MAPCPDSLEDKPKKLQTASSLRLIGTSGQSKLNFSKKRTGAVIKSEPGSVGKRPKPARQGSDPFNIENFVIGRNRTQAGGDTASEANASATCLICKEKNPPDMCASKECGHLCCKVCWVNWLKMKKSCPVCKVPVSEDSIRGITFK